MADIELRGVSKAYGQYATVVADLNLTIADGSFTILVGPSGCGKTTVLRMIAGLTPVSSGTILIGGRDVTALDAGERDVAMVFQNYAIYPHMTVEKNISFGLRNYGFSRSDIERRVSEVLALVGLAPHRHKHPSQLSGGQRQRVALARAISKHPSVFLMDEPLSNLDARLRSQMRVELVELHHRLGSSFVFVTHDQVEAMSMADTIVVMNRGEIQQVGSPHQIYRDPANVFVASFVGEGGMTFVKAPGARLFGFRAGAVSIEPVAKANGGAFAGFRVSGAVRTAEMAGEDFFYTVETSRGVVTAKSPRTFERGESVRIEVTTGSGFLFGDDNARLRDVPQLSDEDFGEVVRVD